VNIAVYPYYYYPWKVNIDADCTSQHSLDFCSVAMVTQIEACLTFRRVIEYERAGDLARQILQYGGDMKREIFSDLFT